MNQKTKMESETVEGPQPVLLITDDVVFRSKVVELWHADPNPPLLICLPSELTPRGEIAWCDAVILGPVEPEHLATTLLAAAAAPAAVAFLPWGVSLQEAQKTNPNLVPLHCSEDGAEAAVLIGKTLLRRTAVERKLNLAELNARDCSRNAALGRFMLESRHSFNNALTTVLGTSEVLLLLDSAKLNEEQKEQVRTVHAMAMRMYQMIARFSALEAELRLTESGTHPNQLENFLSAMPTSGVRQ